MNLVRGLTAYQQVAESLRRRLLNGEIAPGLQLPPERELCEEYSASRITVRRALQILSDEGLIERRQGLGTFVAPSPTRRIPLLNTDFSGSMAAHAPDVDRALDVCEWQKVGEEVAATLQTYAGASVLFARRLDLIGSQVVAYDEIVLPEPMADRVTDDDLAQLRFLERWQRVQRISLTHLTQRIEAIPASRLQAKILDVKTGSPLLKEVDLFFLSTGAPCGLFVSYYRHDLFQLTSTVRLCLDGSHDSSDG